MNYKKGLSSNETLQPSTLSSGINDILSIQDEVNSKLKYGRVVDSILNEEHPQIENYGGLNAIGGVLFKEINFESSGVTFAKPLFPQITNPPLINELIIVFQFASTTENPFTKEIKNEFYYLSPINLWNSPNCNPLPPTTTPSLNKKSYNEVEAGSPNNINLEEKENLSPSLNSPTNPSQNTFEENGNINPLLPFAGDIIYQGRFGNSIRLGNTSYSLNRFNEPRNNWSENGQDGNPITIIKNGINENTNTPGWVPITEDINIDPSSIYLTSNQVIPIRVANANYNSFSTPPVTPNLYNNSQVIINSGQLIFNSKKDNILLSSQKSVFIGANSSFNVSTKEVVIDSRNIKLGSKNAEEPMILGNKFLDNLEIIMKEISVLCKTLSKVKEVTSVNTETGIPNKINAVNGQLKVQADNLSDMIEGGGVGFIDQIESYKSNVNKII